MPTIFEIKEREVLETPILLFDCELRNGQHEYWATHQVTFNGNLYLATLADHSQFDLRAQSEDGIDATAKISLTLANTDSRYSQVERSSGWKGAKLTVRFVFFDMKNETPVSEDSVLFRGIANAPENMRESTLRLSFNNRLNFQRVLLPEIRIQKRCPWMFPSTSAQRLEGIDGGARGAYSPFFRCGYSAGEVGGVGILNDSSPYTSCDYTRSSCEQRGMFKIDGASNITRRFGGVEFVPSSVLVRGYGEKGSHLSGPIDNEAKYNDVVPLIYGTAWVQPPVTLARNDGNLTRMEVLLGAGEMQGVMKMIVNDIEIPLGANGRDMTATGWYNIVSLGNRTGNFNLDFSDGSGNPVGDPYGSMAVVSVVVPNRIHDGRSLPRVKALVEGMKLPTYDSSEAFAGNLFTNNPAWVLLDVLQRSGWDPGELDLPSFAETALYCADPIQTLDLHGNPITVPRFQCNLALRKRRSAADVLRGIRNSAGLLLSFGNGGKLQCRFESTLAVQHAQKPAGSNATETLLNGWPAYEFGDGSTAASGLLRGNGGEPKIRFFSRSSADAPNRFSVEFQDAFNEFQQDSVSLVDIDDVLASGQETSVSLPALGLANFDQATRMVKLQLLKSVKGNLYVEFETSVRGFGLRPGDLITLTYSKEGFLRQPFRVLRLAPGLNHRTTTITAQFHDDDWYVQTAGNGAESSGRQPKYELGLPRPLGGWEIDADGIPQFGVTESYEEATDGSAQTRLTVEFTAPAKPSASRAGIPLVGFSLLSQGTGGTLPGDQVLYYAVSAVDGDGAESGLSFIVRAVIPPGTNTNLVALQSLSFSSSTQTFHVYRGDSPQQLRRVASDVAVAAGYTDTGAADGVIGPPDENYSHANFHWRWELQGPQVAILATWNTVGNPTLTMLGNEYRGQVVRIVSGKGAGQERRIYGNTPQWLTLEDKWAVIPDATSKFAVAEPSWNFGASSSTSPVTFLIPNREGFTVHVSGRSANANDKECPFELCPLTAWRIIGASGMLLDLDVPSKPVFAMQVKGDGTIDLLSVGFPTFVNTRSVAAGTVTIRYWDELLSPSGIFLAAAVDEAATTITVNAEGVLAGLYLQLGEEIMRVEAVAAGGTTLQVTRGSHGSLATAHAVNELVYTLRERTEIVPFSRDFFGSPASGSYNYSVYLPHARVAAADFFVTNQRGDSPMDQRHFTATTEFGLRTMLGGQLNLQVEGPLSIEDDATPPLVIEDYMAMQDIYAVVQEPPTEVPVMLRLRQDADEICTLTIPVNATISNIVDGFGLAPLRGGSLLHLDIVSVGQTVSSTPGADLTVTVRL
ncbi:MAG: phage tail protein [Bryobacteraceae bacterium]